MRQWWSLYQNEEAVLPFEWYDPSTGLLYNFTTGFTFTFQLVNDGKYYFQSTSGITGFAVSPNVTVSFLAGALASVPPNIYLGILIARSGGTNDTIFMENDPPIIEIKKTPVVST